MAIVALSETGVTIHGRPSDAEATAATVRRYKTMAANLTRAKVTERYK